MTRFVRYHLPAVLWAVLTLGLLLTPGGQVTLPPELATPLDRAAHLSLFFVLQLLAVRSFSDLPTCRRPLASAAAAALAYSLLTEALQVLVPGRFSSLEDLVLDAAGIALACGILAWRGAWRGEGAVRRR